MKEPLTPIESEDLPATAHTPGRSSHDPAGLVDGSTQVDISGLPGKLIVLEGIAVTGDKDFDIFQASYPYAQARALEVFGWSGLARIGAKLRSKKLPTRALCALDGAASGLAPSPPAPARLSDIALRRSLSFFARARPRPRLHLRGLFELFLLVVHGEMHFRKC